MSGYISWYEIPILRTRSYLRRDKNGQSFSYVRDKTAATVFESAEQAKAVTPIYDGSSRIEERVGVEAVH